MEIIDHIGWMLRTFLFNTDRGVRSFAAVIRTASVIL